MRPWCDQEDELGARVRSDARLVEQLRCELARKRLDLACEFAFLGGQLQDASCDQQRPATPRAGGERQALRGLVAAREGAVNAKRACLCQLRDLLITTPEPWRSQLRPLSRARLLQHLAATRPDGRRDPELRGSMLALRSRTGVGLGWKPRAAEL